MPALRRALLVALCCVPLPLAAQGRPFGTLREQADLQAARRAASGLKQAYAQLETALRGQAERSTGTQLG